MSSMPMHHGPLVASSDSQAPFALNVKLLKFATVSFAIVHSPIVDISATNEKMTTSAMYTVCILCIMIRFCQKMLCSFREEAFSGTLCSSRNCSIS